jgi:hypothetical protein
MAKASPPLAPTEISACETQSAYLEGGKHRLPRRERIVATICRLLTPHHIASAQWQRCRALMRAI